MISEQELRNRNKRLYGAAIIFGLAVGTGIGAAIDHLSVGISMGICLGVGIAMLLRRK